MNINFKGKEIELKFTFNSFKYMENFKPNDFLEMETNPFKIASVLETLLLGGFNHSPKTKYTEVEIQEYLETFAEDGDVSELLTSLMQELEKSNFFKALQKNVEN
jgi:hypothetical protein